MLPRKPEETFACFLRNFPINDLVTETVWIPLIQSVASYLSLQTWKWFFDLLVWITKVNKRLFPKTSDYSFKFILSNYNNKKYTDTQIIPSNYDIRNKRNDLFKRQQNFCHIEVVDEH